jgi:hypothetical protein
MWALHGLSDENASLTHTHKQNNGDDVDVGMQNCFMAMLLLKY